jgi:hypothetical protein
LSFGWLILNIRSALNWHPARPWALVPRLQMSDHHAFIHEIFRHAIARHRVAQRGFVAGGHGGLGCLATASWRGIGLAQH